jgi:hypothetical protein
MEPSKADDNCTPFSPHITRQPSSAELDIKLRVRYMATLNFEKVYSLVLNIENLNLKLLLRNIYFASSNIMFYLYSVSFIILFLSLS